MRLNHLNLCVDDLAAARDFFVTTFDFELLGEKGGAIIILTDRQGFTLVLADVSRFGGKVPVRYPQGFHVGLLQETRAEVDVVYARLIAAGITPGHPPRNVHGSYGFYFNALGDILFEVACLS